MFGYQNVYTVLISFTVIGTNTCNRVDWVVGSVWLFSIRFLSFLFLISLLFGSWHGFKVDGEELFIDMIVFDSAVDNGFIVWVLFAIWGWVDVFKNEQNIAFDVISECLVGYAWLTFLFNYSLFLMGQHHIHILLLLI